MSVLPCSSAASCFYYSSDLVFNAALSMVSIRSFKEPDPVPRIMTPFTVALIAKVTGLFTYYFSEEVSQNHPDPIAAAGYPGMFAMATGWISKKITGTSIDMSDATLVFIGTVINAAKDWMSREFPPQDLCEILNRYKIKTQPSNPESKWDTLSSFPFSVVNVVTYARMSVFGYSTMVYGRRGHDYLDIYNFFRFGSRYNTLWLGLLFLADGLSHFNVPNFFECYRLTLFHQAPIVFGMGVGYFYNLFLFFKFYRVHEATPNINVVEAFFAAHAFLLFWVPLILNKMC